MDLRIKAPLFLASAAGLIFAATGYTSYRAQFDHIEAMRRHELEAVGTALKSGIEALCRSAAMQADFFANLGSVKEALHARDRERLESVLRPAFTTLGPPKYSTEQVVVDDRDLHVLLDLRAPEREGEDASGDEMVVRASRYRETQAGVEVTGNGLAVRAVAAVDSGTEHLGCVEWGVGFGRLLTYLRDKTHVELSVFVDEHAIAPVAHVGSRSAIETEPGSGLRTVASTNADLVKDVLSNEFLRTVTEAIYTKRERLGVEYEVVALPLFDFAGRQIGVIGGVRTTADSRKDMTGIARTFLGGTLVGVILLALVVYLVFDLGLRRPLATLLESVDGFARGGDIHRPVAHLGRPDEFGVVSKSVNKLREKLVNDARLAEEAENIVTTHRLRKADKDTTIDGA
jgi:hypothetical protein